MVLPAGAAGRQVINAQEPQLPLQQNGLHNPLSVGCGEVKVRYCTEALPAQRHLQEVLSPLSLLSCECGEFRFGLGSPLAQACSFGGVGVGGAVRGSFL